MTTCSKKSIYYWILVFGVLYFSGHSYVYAQSPYCVPTYGNDCHNSGMGLGVYIENFTFNADLGSINHTKSGCLSTAIGSEFINYTIYGNEATVTAGNTYNFSLAIAESSGLNANANVAIWIDFNDNKDFNDVGEQVLSSTNTINSLLSGSITIPTTAKNGTIRMRVRVRGDGNVTTPCGNFGDTPSVSTGDCVDYTMKIVGGVDPISTDCSDFKIFSIAPNIYPCKDINNGSIIISDILGGTPDYSMYYYRQGDNGYTTFAVTNPLETIIPNLSEGEYTIVVTDAKGCVFELKTPLDPEEDTRGYKYLGANVLPLPCNNSSDIGSITLDMSIEAGRDIQFALNDGPFQSSNVFENLGIGDYILKVREIFPNKVCIYEEINPELKITKPDPLSISVSTFSSPTGCASTDGTIEVVGSGGKTPYEFNINSGAYQSGSIFTNLSGDNYTLGIKDFNGCTSTTTQTFATAKPPTLTFVSKTNILCNGAATGTITVSAKDGQAPYIYKIGTITNNDGIFTGLIAGTYTVEVIDDKNCSSSLSVTLTQPSALSMSISAITRETCEDENDGTIQLAAGGGNGVLTYSRSGSVATNTDGFFNNLEPNTYIFTVTDGNGCTKSITETILETVSKIEIGVISKTDESCAGAENGSVNLSASGGVEPYLYAMNGSATTFTDGLFQNLSPGDYTFIVFDKNSCQKTIDITINAAPAHSKPTGVSSITTCKNESVTITPTPQSNILFNFYATDPALGVPTILQTKSNSYTITSLTNTVEIWITAEKNGCESEATKITITAYDCASISDPCSCKNNATTLTNGQFDETIEIDAPNGQNWTVKTVSGLYAASSAAPPNAPTPITIGTAFTYDATSKTYKLNAIHIDGIGYSIVATNGLTDLTINNLCWYPNPDFTLPVSICANGTPINLVGSAQLGNNAGAAQGSGVFSINSNTATVFNPSSYGVGNKTVVYTFDANDNIPNTQHPGCIQRLEKVIEVLGSPEILPNITKTTCPNGNDGSIQISINGASGSYGYTWTGPAGFSGANTKDISGLKAGDYTVVVTDLVNGCSSTATYKVPQGADLDKPNALCKNIQVSLSTAGNATITAAQINNGTTDNCGLSSLSLNKTDFNCSNIGANTVVLTATDNSGNTATCNATVTIQDITPPSVICPSDIVYFCNNLPSNGVIPPTTATATDNCTASGSIAITYSDATYTFICGANTTNKPSGYPNAAPYNATLANNATKVVLRTFTAKDGSNNSSTCYQVFYIKTIDVSKIKCPASKSVYCQSGNLYTLPEDGTLNGVSYLGTGKPLFSDGTSLEQLPCNLTVTYEDTKSNVYLSKGWAFQDIRRDWYIKNACGQVVFTCVQGIEIIDQYHECLTVPITLSGLISSAENNSLISKVSLYKNGSLIAEQSGSKYEFKDLEGKQNYTIVPSKTDNPLVGITTFDIALISRHLLNTSTDNLNPYRIIAGDVNRDKQLDGADMLLIRQLILRRIQSFPNGPIWRFISKLYPINNPDDPLASYLPENINFNNINFSFNQGDFIGVKLGDLNNSAGFNSASKERNVATPLSIFTNDMLLEEGKTYKIPLSVKSISLAALQFALKIEDADILAVNAGDLPHFNEGNCAIFNEKGLITTAWAISDNFKTDKEITLYHIVLKAHKNAKISEIISLQDAVTEGVAYDIVGNGAPVKLHFVPQVSKLTLLPNYPNPFSDETILPFIMPHDEYAQFSVYDLTGRVLMQKNQVFTKGLNTIKIKITDPSVGGILVCRLATAKQTVESKMILVK